MQVTFTIRLLYFVPSKIFGSLDCLHGKKIVILKLEIYFEKSILFKVPSTMLGNEPGPDDQKEVFKLHTRGRIDKEKWSQEFAPISRKIMK